MKIWSERAVARVRRYPDPPPIERSGIRLVVAGRKWTYIQQYADAKTEVIATIMDHVGEESAR